MFYEYAVDPAVLSSWQNARFFLDAFGSWRGRFLADYPHKLWKRLVLDGLACADVERLKIVERLHLLDSRTLSARPGSSYVVGRPWLDNAKIEHEKREFHAIISTQPRSGERILDATEVTEQEPRWKVEQGMLVDRDPELMVKVLSLLLRESKHVVLVDPFFRLDKGAKAAALAAFCRAMQGQAVKIEVCLRLGEDLDPDYEWVKNEMEVRLPRHIPVGSQVTVRFLANKETGPRLHNRYVLTNVGGVQFGDSIERGQSGHQDHISILDESSRATLWRQYADPGDGFSVAGAPLVVPGTKKPYGESPRRSK